MLRVTLTWRHNQLGHLSFQDEQQFLILMYVQLKIIIIPRRDCCFALVSRTAFRYLFQRFDHFHSLIDLFVLMSSVSPFAPE